MQLALDVIEDLNVRLYWCAIKVAQPLERDIDGGNPGRLEDSGYGDPAAIFRSTLAGPIRLRLRNAHRRSIIHALTVADRLLIGLY